MPNLATKDDVLRFCAQKREEMESSWRRRGRFEMNGYSFGGWVFATRKLTKTRPDAVEPEDWQPGEPLERVRAHLCQLPTLVRLLRPDERNTDVFGYTMRHFARATAAIGVLICGEFWMYKMEGTDGTPLSREEAQKRRDALPKDLGDAPGRGEMLFMNLEHKAVGRRFWLCEIHRNPSRLGSWEEAPLEDTEGRLVEIVSVTN